MVTIRSSNLFPIRRSLPGLPPPVSEIDQKVLKLLEENRVTQIDGGNGGFNINKKLGVEKEEEIYINKVEGRGKDWKEGLKKMMEEGRKAKKTEDVALVEGEVEVIQSGNWRDEIKDLGESFSRLPPINQNKKVIPGKGQSFYVEM